MGADVVGQKLNCRCEDGLDAAMIEVTSEALVGKHCATKNRTLRHLMFASILSSLRLFSSLRFASLRSFAPFSPVPDFGVDQLVLPCARVAKLPMFAHDTPVDCRVNELCVPRGFLFEDWSHFGIIRGSRFLGGLI